MAGKVFFSVSMSLDGFIAPESLEGIISPERQDDPQLQRWAAQWMELQQWIFPQRFFRENLKLGEGGEEGRDNDVARQTFERTGASVMGKRMFDLGERAWPEEAPFHTPVFVMTHEKRDPWERPGGTTFHFVNDGIETALDQAREAMRRPRRPHRGRRRNDPGVRERRPGRRVLDRALTRALRQRNPPVRGRGRGSRGPGAGPRGADAAGDPPDLRSPGAVTVSTVTAWAPGPARLPWPCWCQRCRHRSYPSPRHDSLLGTHPARHGRGRGAGGADLLAILVGERDLHDVASARTPPSAGSRRSVDLSGSDYRVTFDHPPEHLGTVQQQLTFEDFVEPTSCCVTFRGDAAGGVVRRTSWAAMSKRHGRSRGRPGTDERRPPQGDDLLSAALWTSLEALADRRSTPERPPACHGG